MEIRIWPRLTHRPKRKMNKISLKTLLEYKAKRRTSKCITIAAVDCLLNVPCQFKLRVDVTGQIEYNDWTVIWEKEMMARPFPPSPKFTCRIVPYRNNRGRQPHSYILVWSLMGWLKMITTNEMNSKVSNVVYLYTFIGHGIPSKSREFIYFILELYMFCSPSSER